MRGSILLILVAKQNTCISYTSRNFYCDDSNDETAKHPEHLLGLSQYIILSFEGDLSDFDPPHSIIRF